MKIIRTIETPVVELKRFRVCAYVRVATDRAEQQNDPIDGGGSGCV
ncbi:hypothetical protein [Desulfitobacterium sp. AusDCA]